MKFTGVLTLFLCLFFYQSAISQTKHALLIGIAVYPNDTAKKQMWSNLHSDQDLKMLQSALQSQGFDRNNIHSLTDKEATPKNIEERFRSLIHEVDPGDIVMVHFSGHGQQVRDLSGDEHDGYDEAIVCYEAPVMCYDGYRGEDHLLDDSLSIWFDSLRESLGEKGHLLVLFDTCHSGTMSKGGEEGENRGGRGPLEFDCNKGDLIQTNSVSDLTGWNELADAESVETQRSSIVVISACKSNEVNSEILPDGKGIWCGPLSFAFVQVLKKPGLSNLSYSNLLDELRKTIGQAGRLNGRTQTPQIEGNWNTKVLNGTALEPSTFLDVYPKKGMTIEIDGGFLAGHSIGDSLAVFDAEKLSVPLTVGVITELHETRSVVKIKNILSDALLFKAKHFYSVPALIPRTIKLIGVNWNYSKCENELKKNPNFKLLKEGLSDYTLEFSKGAFILYSSDGITPLRSMTSVPIDSIDFLHKLLDDIVLVEKFRDYAAADTSVKLDVSCIRLKTVEPCDYSAGFNPDCIKLIDTIFLGRTDWVNDELHAIKDNDRICVYVNNSGNEALYVNIFEICPNGMVIHHKKKDEIDGNHKIVPIDKPRSLIVLRESAKDGFGNVTIKLVVSKERLDLSSSPVLAHGGKIDVSGWSKQEQSDNDVMSWFSQLSSRFFPKGPDGDKDISIINIPLIMTK